MNNKFLSGSSIKIIAVIAMFVDHFGVIILKNVFIMNANYSFFSDKQFQELLILTELTRVIGRLAFPLFCFLIVEGFCHTSNVKKYISTMILLAIITEPIYDWTLTGNLINFEEQNVLFTLALGILTLEMIKKFGKKYLLVIGIIVISCFLSYILKLDGWYYGILLMSSFYIFRNTNNLKLISAAIIMFVCTLDFSLSTFLDPYYLMSALSLVVIYFYNGKRGLSLKYFFYLFYPLHLLVLKIIAILLMYCLK